MKKIILTTAFITISFLQSFSQINIGLKAGVNLSNAKDLIQSTNSSRLGINAGLSSTISISKQFIVQPELLYSEKGYQYIVSQYSSTKGKLLLQYLSVPLLVGYLLNNRFTFLLGPEFNYLLKATAKADGNSNKATDLYHLFDIAGDVGILHHISKRWGAEIRYSHSLKKLIDVAYVDPGGSLIYQMKTGGNSVFQLGLIYQFYKK